MTATTKDAEAAIHLNSLPTEPRSKPAPSSPIAGLHFSYAKSPSDVDSNLLILLHGLGDNEKNFFDLGKHLQRTLPQTAVLSLRAPWRVPLLEAESFMWWETFTPLMEKLPNQDPTPFTKSFSELICHLVSPVAESSSDVPGCGWLASSIHLLGFGQGGTAALEGTINWTLDRRKQSRAGAPNLQSIGSVVTISGPLISYPTFTPSIATPVLLYHRFPTAAPNTNSTLTPIKRAFQPSKVTEHAAPPIRAGGDVIHEAMPRAREGEWDPIVRWWAQRGGWRNRSEMEMSEGVLHVG